MRGGCRRSGRRSRPAPRWPTPNPCPRPLPPGQDNCTSNREDPTGESEIRTERRIRVPPSPRPRLLELFAKPHHSRIEGAPTPMRVRLDLPCADREGGVAAGGGGGGRSLRPVGAEARRALALGGSLGCLFGFAFALRRIFLVGFTHPSLPSFEFDSSMTRFCSSLRQSISCPYDRHRAANQLWVGVNLKHLMKGHCKLLRSKKKTYT
jgi:hypothetical protein